MMDRNHFLRMIQRFSTVTDIYDSTMDRVLPNHSKLQTLRQCEKHPASLGWGNLHRDKAPTHLDNLSELHVGDLKNHFKNHFNHLKGEILSTIQIASFL